MIEARVSHEELLFHPFACPSLFLKMIFNVINPFRIRGVLVFHTQECERLYLDQTMVIGCAARVKFAQYYLTKYIVCLWLVGVLSLGYNIMFICSYVTLDCLFDLVLVIYLQVD